ncbi:hypothetical protein HZS_6412 [Henneguya salminicola]|nr:hypothetical protein HZS_6412 [Henneguya salminicola]
MTLTVTSKKTTPFLDQNPGTSGLRKKTEIFMQQNYTENFIQSIFANLSLETRKSGTLVIGGDGRYYCVEAAKIAIKIAAANQIKKIIICYNGLGSTPAISHLINKYSAIGAIILTASHNPGGPDKDFGIKFNVSSGGMLFSIYPRWCS